jgi:hypothetical protein
MGNSAAGRSPGSTTEAVADLSEMLLRLVNDPDRPWDHCLYQELARALQKLAADLDLQYEVGLKALGSHPSSPPFPRTWSLGMAMLAKSGRKEALDLRFGVLMKMLTYDNGEGIDHSSSLISTATDASEALNEIAGTDTELQYQVGLEGIKSPWTPVIVWGAQMLAKSGRKEAIDPLLKLEDYGVDQIRQAARKAVRALAGD